MGNRPIDAFGVVGLVDGQMVLQFPLRQHRHHAVRDLKMYGSEVTVDVVGLRIDDGDWARMEEIAKGAKPPPDADAPARDVTSISDKELVGRAVRNACGARPGQPKWAAVMGVFALGSTFAAQLCRIHGIDPDSIADHDCDVCYQRKEFGIKDENDDEG